MFMMNKFSILRCFLFFLITCCYFGDLALFASAPSTPSNARSGNQNANETPEKIYNRMSATEKAIIDKFNADIKNLSGEKRDKAMGDFIGANIYGHQNIVHWIIASNLVTDQNIVNFIFYQGDDDTKQLLINNNLIPSQNEINYKFKEAVKNDDQNKVEWMLINNLRPDQDSINQVFFYIVGGKQPPYVILDWLLANNIRPNQTFTRRLFTCGSVRPEQMQWMLNNGFTPNDQDTINRAFTNNVGTVATGARRFMLNNNLIPDESNLVIAYRNAVSVSDREMIELLRPLVPQYVINEQNQNANQRPANINQPNNNRFYAQQRFEAPNNARGQAFEIHNFANVVMNDACRIITGKLTQAGKQPNTYTSFENSVQKIRQSATKQNIALTNTFEDYIRCAADIDKNLLSLVTTFVLSFYPDSFDDWVKGVMVDSAQAYQCSGSSSSSSSSSAPSDSCTRGFWERVVTSIIYINNDQLATKDPELSRILGSGQNKLLLSKKIDSFVNLEFISKALSESNLSKQCSMDELKAKAQEILRSKFNTNEEFKAALLKVAEYSEYGFWERLYQGHTGKEYVEK